VPLDDVLHVDVHSDMPHRGREAVAPSVVRRNVLILADGDRDRGQDPSVPEAEIDRADNLCRPRRPRRLTAKDMINWKSNLLKPGADGLARVRVFQFAILRASPLGLVVPIIAACVSRANDG